MQPPAAIPPGDAPNERYVRNQFKFDQLGVRVPALVISPYTKKGTIDHTVYDHTSMLASVEHLFAMKNLTARDKAANDFLHLVSLATARIDAPTKLPEIAVNPNPLNCEEESEVQLLAKIAELKTAQQTGFYNGKPVETYTLTPSQIGFVQVALLKVVNITTAVEQLLWIAAYKAIKTGVDAALFMAEAKLKLRYLIDVNNTIT